LGILPENATFQRQVINSGLRSEAIPRHFSFLTSFLKEYFPNVSAMGEKGWQMWSLTGPTNPTRKSRIFLCQTCGKAFSSRTGTAFFDLRTPKKRILVGLLLAEGLGLRGTSRVLEIKLDTIRRWLAVAAIHCEQVSDILLREFSRVQVD
jgi:hypothetical protein